MHMAINRLDQNVPDPVESRRRAAGRLVRTVYAASVIAVLAFFVIYFGAPLVVLSGPGTVSSPQHVISLPYVVQVRSMNVTAGAMVKAGQEIGQVRSPEQDGIVATYMRALAEISTRQAELRIKARVAQETLEPSHAYRKLTEDASNRIEETPASASLAFRVEMLRERALARKTVVSQEAEIAEAITQLSNLDEFGHRIRERLDEVEQNFAGGRVLAPVDGIVSTNLAHAGQSLVAGTPVAVILDPADIFVDWYVPSSRLIEPAVGDEVLVVFGNRRIAGMIVEILPVSDVYGARPQLVPRDRPATQIARVRFTQKAAAPPLNSTVNVRMYYMDFALTATTRLAHWLGLQ
jgi:multidrug resistance efflux pump